jgi:peptidoglycan-associated lipoprotein
MRFAYLSKAIRPVCLLLSAVFLLSACANSYVVLLENPDGRTGEVVVTGEKGKQVIKTAGYGASLDGSETPAPVSAAKIKSDFSAAMTARPKVPLRYILYFQSDATLTAESEALIPKIIAEAVNWPAVDISVVGHTDTLGAAEINESLALVRAVVMADLLKEKGLKYNSLNVESHGERNLLIPTPDDTLEPRNRRVEVSIR